MGIYIPQGILIDIVRRIGKEGFRELGPFISGGPEWRNAALVPEVLQEVDLDEFIFVSSQANEGSIYRPFLMRCFEVGNVTAMYVEGIRRAVKNGHSNENLQLMRRGEEAIPCAGFAFGIFAICGGKSEEGMASIALLSSRVGWLEEMVDIADRVMAQIADIEPSMTGKYDATYAFPRRDIPNCTRFACTEDDVCFDCIPYWYSRRVRNLC